MNDFSFRQFITDIYSAEVSGLSALVDTVIKIQDGRNILSEADKWKMIADSWSERVVEFSKTASQWEQRAAEASTSFGQLPRPRFFWTRIWG